MDTNTPRAAASFASFVESVAASGLIPGDELAPVLAAADSNQQVLRKLLTAKGLLTPFQLAAVGEGRGKALRVGNYDLLDRLGAGGMGTVFKARHRRMKRVVALKVLATSISENEVFVKRFQREVETLACLGHPNIVMAYDADEAEIGHFLVMEFVSGHDLAACVEQEGPFSLAHAIDCVLQAARGLAYAHAQGIVHRDIKPHNLLRADSGVVKVTDLGLARISQPTDGALANTGVTMAGNVIGTAAYMSPEQAVDSTTIDHRADIYSLGCTLYFLLTGRPPFAGATIMSTLLKHRDAEIPSLDLVRPDAPPRLDALLRRMLAKRPEDRIPTMSAVAIELQAIAESIDPVASQNANAVLTLEMPGGLALSAATISSDRPSDSTLAVDVGAAQPSVLIVEPSRVQASIIGQFLQDHAWPVAGTVATGTEAVQAVRTLGPPAVISAMHLADMSGADLARQLRAEVAGEAPGFLLVTSESDDSESAALSKLDRVMLLQKPFSSQQLVEALHLVTGLAPRLLAGSPGERAPWSARKADRSRLRVLLVDDSSTARRHQRTVLEGLGFGEFVEVADGAYAIAVAARESFDLIVTDYNMPLMDGRALVSYLKQNPPTAAVPIVMATSETDPRVLEPVRQLGVVAILGKAFPASAVGPLIDQLF